MMTSEELDQVLWNVYTTIRPFMGFDNFKDEVKNKMGIKQEIRTCKGCKHLKYLADYNITVCWLPFTIQKGDVHTVSCRSEEDERCEYYDDKK